MVALKFLVFALFAGATQAFFQISGVPTTIDKYPSLVQVDSLAVSTGLWSQTCAGTILNSVYIVTAASCFYGITYNPNNRRVRAGSTYRNRGGILAYVLTEYNHPTYGRNGHDGDISVVRLRNTLMYSPEVASGTIIGQGAVFPAGILVVHAGWGASIRGGSASSGLLETIIYIIQTDICRQRYEILSTPEIVTGNMICAGFPVAIESDTCLGDYGGPIYYEDVTFGSVLIGMVSWGHGCTNSTLPGVATAISSYSNWIVATAV